MYAIVDASSVAYRAYYAAPLRGLKDIEDTPEGLQNATRAFMREFCNHIVRTSKELDSKRPEFVYTFICWDGRKSVSLRREIYEDYKGNREEHRDPRKYITPHRFINIAREELARVSDRFGLIDKYAEADDLIAIICELLRDNEKVIVTRDKDMLQLVDTHTQLYDPYKRAYYNEQAVIDECGVAPSKIVDYKAIVGDASDNYYGVSGVGPKRGAAILNAGVECSTLSKDVDIFRQLAKIPYHKFSQTAILRKLSEIEYTSENKWEYFCNKWELEDKLRRELDNVV